MLRIIVLDLAYNRRSRSAGLITGLCIALTACLLSLSLSKPAKAQTEPACTPEMARVTSVQGQVEIRWTDTEAWRDARLEDVLCTGTTVRVGPVSRAGLVFADDSTLRLDQSTTLIIRERENERRTWLDMIGGAIHFFSHRPRSLGVETPFVNAAAEGTEFLIRVGDEDAHILMYEGLLLAQNEEGELRLGPNDAALIRKGERPIPEIVIRPRDAVAWAVYYPPVIPDLADGSAPGVYPLDLKTAIERANDNDYAGALRSLNQTPPDDRDIRHETLRAGILLNVGRVTEAEAVLKRALALDASSSDAYALRTILHVVRNDRAQALRDADRAVQFSPTSSAALIAQSYARQASFDLEGARESLRQAVEKNPNDALAHARLAEIELSFADYDRANEAADQATRLAPNLARTQTVQGFSRLAEIDTDAARTAFTRAIELESTDPLAYLGQGLAKIREGHLEQGRRDLEIAASLDPNNALIRSYLGKAYFEEKRGPKDATQFDIAKKLDPNDPTPWFYDAIRKQTENRPVEALRDLEKAIELNDNRAIYRSSLLLDEDRAARGVSLARIYDDLGFDQLALAEASKSLNLDFSNHSAHRFLSDAYAKIPRHEIARVSELLKAQLLQPVNINPAQPSITISDFDIASRPTPTQAAFNDFYSTFARNQLRLTGSGFFGTQDTVGGEVTASGLWNKFSFSAGQYYSDSNGFRPNNNLTNEIYNLFAQIALTPKLNFQAEHRTRSSELGDIAVAFDPDFVDTEFRAKIDQETNRLGFKYSPTISSDFIGSFFHSELDERFPPFSAENEETGFQAETQYVLSTPNTSWIAGGGSYQVDVTRRFGTVSNSFDRSHDNAYLYSEFQLPRDVIWTLGLSYDSFKQNTLEINKPNPKIGVQWTLNSRIQLRAAAFETVKRALLVEQTIEPTEIAGFNQFFDDFNGTKARRYGAGLDAHLSRNLYGGVELTKRERKVPRSGAFEERPEHTHRTYLYWTPNNNMALSFELFYDLFRSQESSSNRPAKVESISIPANIYYFRENGIFAQFGINYIHQTVKRRENASFPDGSDDFILFNAELGYRLKNRRGIASLEVNNIFDNEFKLEDENFRTNRFTSPRFIPDTTVLAKFSFNF